MCCVYDNIRTKRLQKIKNDSKQNGQWTNWVRKVQLYHSQTHVLGGLLFHILVLNNFKLLIFNFTFYDIILSFDSATSVGCDVDRILCRLTELSISGDPPSKKLSGQTEGP